MNDYRKLFMRLFAAAVAYAYCNGLFKMRFTIFLFVRQTIETRRRRTRSLRPEDDRNIIIIIFNNILFLNDILVQTKIYKNSLLCIL